MNKFTTKTLDLIKDNLLEKTLNNRLSNITLINSKDILFSFTTYREEKLLVSLNHQMPFISFIKIDESYPTIISQTNDNLRKYLKDGLIKNYELVNNDRVLKIEIEKSNDYFEKETRFLIIELIPHRPNLIITDSKNIVLFAMHYSSLIDKYMVIHNLEYYPLAKNENYRDSADYFIVNELKDYAKSYLFNAKEDRKKEKFESLIKHLNSRIKSLNRKLIVLNDEILKAQSSLIYKDHANMILAYQYDSESLVQYISENNLSLIPDKSIGENANLLFNKYKKAKRTLEMDKLELEKAQNDIRYYENLKLNLVYMNENDLKELQFELNIKTNEKSKDKKPKLNISYIEYNDSKIFFGKNATQNEYLTFKFSNKNDLYLHVKDYHGSHILIKEENPSQDTILVAAELALILTGLQLGNVYCTTIKNVKKGSQKGEANLLSYKEITINKVRESTYDLLKNYKVI